MVVCHLLTSLIGEALDLLLQIAGANAVRIVHPILPDLDQLI
jgi:hypothetical protein